MTESATVTNPYQQKLLARFTESRVVPQEPSGIAPALSQVAQAIKQAVKEVIKEGGPVKTESVVSEKACDYIYRAVDRQINKARGVLAYNGLLFASFSLAARSSTDKRILMLASVGAIVALLSCFPLLYLMVFNLGEDADYETAKSEFEATFKAVWSRAKSLTVSLWLSLLATLIAVLIPIIFLSILLR